MKLAKYLFITFGILLFTYTVIMLFLLGYSAGAIALFLLSAVFILLGIFLPWFVKHRTILVLISVCILLIFLFMLFLLIYGATQAPSNDIDVIIVLGAQIEGKVVLDHLASRLDVAFDYAKDHPDIVIVVSGGQGKGESIPEGDAMKRYLVDRGIVDGRIWVEEKSTSTYENLMYSKTILEERFDGEYRTVIVSSDYHIFRASLIANKLGYSASYLASDTKWYEYPYRVARECVAFCKLVLLGR